MKELVINTITRFKSVNFIRKSTLSVQNFRTRLGSLLEFYLCLNIMMIISQGLYWENGSNLLMIFLQKWTYRILRIQHFDQHCTKWGGFCIIICILPVTCLDRHNIFSPDFKRKMQVCYLSANTYLHNNSCICKHIFTNDNLRIISANLCSLHLTKLHSRF